MPSNFFLTKSFVLGFFCNKSLFQKYSLWTFLILARYILVLAVMIEEGFFLCKFNIRKNHVPDEFNKNFIRDLILKHTVTLYCYTEGHTAADSHQIYFYSSNIYLSHWIKIKKCKGIIEIKYIEFQFHIISTNIKTLVYDLIYSTYTSTSEKHKWNCFILLHSLEMSAYLFGVF